VVHKMVHRRTLSLKTRRVEQSKIGHVPKLTLGEPLVEVVPPPGGRQRH